MTEKLYIDCEFNGFGGELISMALVDNRGNQFYEVMNIEDDYDDWVLAHVVPILGKDAVTPQDFQKKLEKFLVNYSLGGFTLIADWPDDIKYFCEALITSPGRMMAIPGFTAVLDRSIGSGASKIPHNALADAIAIRDGSNQNDQR